MMVFDYQTGHVRNAYQVFLLVCLVYICVDGTIETSAAHCQLANQIILCLVYQYIFVD